MQEDAKEKQEAEQRERQQLRVVGQRRGAASVGDAGQGGHQVQGVIGGVEALTGCRCGGEREAEKSAGGLKVSMLLWGSSVSCTMVRP